MRTVIPNMRPVLSFVVALLAFAAPGNAADLPTTRMSGHLGLASTDLPLVGEPVVLEATLENTGTERFGF